MSNSASHRLELALQFCLFWLLSSSVWCLLVPEPQTTSGHRLRLFSLGLSACLSCGFWIAGWSWSLLIKCGAIAAFVAAILAATIAAAHHFDAAGHILTPARLKEGRIVHDGIGVSYAILPNFDVDLTPTITRSLSRPLERTGTPPRLRHGEVANVCQMIEAVSSRETGHGPAWIVLEVQRGRIADLNTFIRDVRREETKWAALPHFRITRPTHVSQAAGIETVEFEFVKEPQHLRARQVYLRTDTCVLHFLLNSEVESDLSRFDEFVHSIRLDGPR